MNFDWLNRSIVSGEAFLLLGLMVPALCVILTVAWLRRQGLIRFSFRPAPTTRSGRRNDEAALARRSSMVETPIGGSAVARLEAQRRERAPCE